MSRESWSEIQDSDHKAQLLAAWMDDQLDDKQREGFEAFMATDEVFASSVKACQSAMLQAEDFEVLDVPQWNKHKTFMSTSQQTNAWWQWSGLSVLSFGMSVVAVCLVLLKVDVQTGPDGMLISFAGKGSQARIEQLVAQRLKEFEREQSAYLVDNVTQLRQDQQLAQTSTIQYLLNASREERREEFAEFIRFINQQRADDQLFYARQFNKLEQRIYPPLTDFDE